MLNLDLGGGAELRTLEPWQAEEFLAAIGGARGYLRPLINLPGRVVNLDGARNVLLRYAVMQASDTGRVYGIFLYGTLRGHGMFRKFDPAGGT